MYPGLIFFFYLSTMVGWSSGRRENLLCSSLSVPATRQYVLGSLAASSTGGCLSGLSPVRILSWYAVLPSFSRLLPVVLEHVIGHWVLKQLVEDHWPAVFVKSSSVPCVPETLGGRCGRHPPPRSRSLHMTPSGPWGNVLVCSRLRSVVFEHCIKNRRNSHVRVILYLHYLYIIIIIIIILIIIIFIIIIIIIIIITSPRQNTHIE